MDRAGPAPCAYLWLFKWTYQSVLEGMEPDYRGLGRGPGLLVGGWGGGGVYWESWARVTGRFLYCRMNIGKIGECSCTYCYDRMNAQYIM